MFKVGDLVVCVINVDTPENRKSYSGWFGIVKRVPAIGDVLTIRSICREFSKGVEEPGAHGLRFEEIRNPIVRVGYGCFAYNTEPHYESECFTKIHKPDASVFWSILSEVQSGES